MTTPSTGSWGGRGAARGLPLAAIAISLLLPAAASAQVRSLEIPVRGMTCILCTRGVEESIQQLDPVSRVAADLSSGQVRVEAAEGRSLDIAQVRERVVKAGFEVGGECHLVAVGRFTIGPERRILFRVRDTQHTYRVLEGSHLRALFKNHPGLEGEFVLGFRLHDHEKWNPAAISITAFELLAPQRAGR